MLVRKLRTFVVTIVAIASIVSCGKKDDDKKKSADEEVTGTEALTLSVASENLGTVGENDSGLLLGGPTSVGLTALAGFDVEDDCKDSGTVSDDFSSSQTGWPLYTAYCNIVKRPDGPDTIRGALDRASGWVCGIGDIVYDGEAREIEMEITTDCFSKTFVDMVDQELGTTTLDATVTGYDDVDGVGPDGFEKYLTFETDIVTYTILVHEGDDTRAIAVKDGLPDAESGDTFSVYMDKANGAMKVEGRFSPVNEDDTCDSNDDDTNCRHVRFEMSGELNEDFEITNVEDLHFLGGEASYYVSLSGTPADGRVLRYRTTGDDYATASASTDDGECYGEDDATCSGNSGILVTDPAYLFNGTRDSDWTNAALWFEESSFLGSTDELTESADADIWE
jgi:hypothetical protein